MRLKTLGIALSAVLIMVLSVGAQGSQFTDVMARWSRSVKYENDMAIPWR